MNQQTARLNNLRIAPRKARLVANLLKGLSVQEAEAELLLKKQRAARPLLKLLRSGIANAKNNKKLNSSQLFIKSIIVNQGPMFKRFMPRAMGRATPIQKKTSHIVLVLEESSVKAPQRFIISPPPKKEKKTKIKKPTSTSRSGAGSRGSDQGIGKEKVGFLKRIFRRKAI